MRERIACQSANGLFVCKEIIEEDAGIVRDFARKLEREGGGLTNDYKREVSVFLLVSDGAGSASVSIILTI